jgi:hypothetical protein
MKKQILNKSVLLVLLTMAIFSCRKKEPVYTEESFAVGYLNQTGFLESTAKTINSFAYEKGLEFKPKVNGKITSLLVQIPDIRTDLRIIIWDKATKSPLRTEIVNVAVANTQYNFDIKDIELQKDKEYAITMNSGDFYIRKKSDGSSVVYPFTIGNITILAFGIGYEALPGLNTLPIYPSGKVYNYYLGDLFFKFIQTN